MANIYDLAAYRASLIDPFERLYVEYVKLASDHTLAIELGNRVIGAMIAELSAPSVAIHAKYLEAGRRAYSNSEQGIL